MIRSYPAISLAASAGAYGEGMDLQCPATIICLAPRDEVPTSVAGHVLVAGYAYGLSVEAAGAPVPMHPAPAEKFWETIQMISDQHRGEGVLLLAPAADLGARDLRGVALSVDSLGPVRIDAGGCG